MCWKLMLSESWTGQIYYDMSIVNCECMMTEELLVTLDDYGQAGVLINRCACKRYCSLSLFELKEMIIVVEPVMGC